MQQLNLSETQSDIWFDQQREKLSTKYNIGGYVEINGHLDLQKFRQAILLFLDSHTIESFS